MRQFVTLVSQSIPWMDHLLAPRWDMIKVLKQAAEQLGLMQDYLEEDESISFLHGDYRVASRNTISTMDEDDDVPLEATQAPTAMSNATSTYPSTPDQQSHTVGGDTGMTVSVLRWTGWPSNMKPSKLSGVVSHHPFLVSLPLIAALFFPRRRGSWLTLSVTRSYCSSSKRISLSPGLT